MSSVEGAATFYALPEAEQVRGLERLASEALRAWDLDGAKLTPVAYRENMTFRVDAGDRDRFALRIHQAGYRSDDEIRSELAFMTALREGGVRTPEVVAARDGSLLVRTRAPTVPEERQCDLFEWIEGRLLRSVDDASLASPDLEAAYAEVGRQAASIANIAEAWQPPAGFSRPAWDAEGIFGREALLGDWRRLASLSDGQRDLFERLSQRLRSELNAFGQTPDRYGLSHGDFLPENLVVCDDGLRLIDFDDCGASWTLFEFATALFDLLGHPAFDACLAALVAGFRERRSLPEEHLARFPSFALARGLSYLGWAATRSHLDKAHQLAPRLTAALEALAPGHLASEAPG